MSRIVGGNGKRSLLNTVLRAVLGDRSAWLRLVGGQMREVILDAMKEEYEWIADWAERHGDLRTARRARARYQELCRKYRTARKRKRAMRIVPA